MSRRSGQNGSVQKKGSQWHLRYYVDVPGQEKRPRRSLPLGPCKGPNKIGRKEAERKAKEKLAELGVNTEEHLKKALSGVYTFAQRVAWCKQNRRAWLKGRPGPVKTMESQLHKHILPFFGDLPLDDITEDRVQEFITHLQTTEFERRKPNGRDRKLIGDVVKKYQLSPKSIENIVGLVKLIVGKKTSRNWELDLPKSDDGPKQRYFTRQEMDMICELACGQFKTLFQLLRGTGMRIGEACGLEVEHLWLPEEGPGIVSVRQSFSETSSRMLPPKTWKSVREIDIDEELTRILRQHLAGAGIASGLVFRSTNGKPLRGGNVIKRTLSPILRKLGIPTGGKVNHAFRHGRVTVLRKSGVSDEAILRWIGHTVTRTKGTRT